MAYEHNVIGGNFVHGFDFDPETGKGITGTGIVATFNPTGITYDPEDAAPSGNPSDNVPDMMKRRSWILDGVTLNKDGYTQGNSLN